MPIVVRGARIVAPDIRLGHLMEWIIRAGRKLRIVSVDHAEAKNPGGRAAIPLPFSKTRLVLPRQTSAPGQAILPEQHGNGRPVLLPRTTALALVCAHFALDRIPTRRNPHQQLGAIIRHPGGMYAACQKERENVQTDESGDRHPGT